ncbi:MAG TPA: hypothetical protein VGF32_18600 [Streptosporangiaceae bacterium]
MTRGIGPDDDTRGIGPDDDTRGIGPDEDTRGWGPEVASDQCPGGSPDPLTRGSGADGWPPFRSSRREGSGADGCPLADISASSSQPGRSQGGPV